MEQNLKNELNNIINLFKVKKFSEAYNKSKIFLKTNNSEFCLNIHGMICINLDLFEESVSAFKRAITIKNEFPEAYNNLGVAYSHLGNPELAIKNFLKSISLKKDYSSAYNNLGSIYDDTGNFEEAIENYSLALKYNPNNVEAKTNLIEILTFYRSNHNYDNEIVYLNSEIFNFNLNLNNKLDINNLSLCFNNAINKIKKLEQLNFFPKTQIYRKNTIDLNCKRHHKVFNETKVIPEFCFGCYKIQIEPKNIIELIKLHFIFDEIKLDKNNTRKCFVELRPEVSGLYKGLIYCSGFEEANEIVNKIKPFLQKKIDNKILIKIKRGCSEFYSEFPNYNNIKQNDINFMNFNSEWKKKEIYIDQIISKGSKKKRRILKKTMQGSTINDFLIMNNWFNYAKLINDNTYKNISENFIESFFIKNIMSNQLALRQDYFRNQKN